MTFVLAGTVGTAAVDGTRTGPSACSRSGGRWSRYPGGAGSGRRPALIRNAPQVLTRGPIHEAFAAPVVHDPASGPVIPKQPPDPIQEMPPDQKPAGQNVQWIPGYWSWDVSRNDYLWVSGIWRDPPPNSQWVPGYWHQVQGAASGSPARGFR